MLTLALRWGNRVVGGARGTPPGGQRLSNLLHPACAGASSSLPLLFRDAMGMACAPQLAAPGPPGTHIGHGECADVSGGMEDAAFSCCAPPERRAEKETARNPARRMQREGESRLSRPATHPWGAPFHPPALNWPLRSLEPVIGVGERPGGAPFRRARAPSRGREDKPGERQHTSANKHHHPSRSPPAPVPILLHTASAAPPRPPPPSPWARTSRRPSWWPALRRPSSRASP